LGKDGNIVTKQYPHSVHELYDKYSGMLFGYIYEIVKDTRLAEQHLISFYSNLKEYLDEINADGANTWCQLQRLAKRHLSASFINTTAQTESELVTNYTGNKCLGMMTSEQRHVFCNIYYHGKTVAELAYSLNKPEDIVRKHLKDAFTILKQRA